MGGDAQHRAHRHRRRRREPARDAQAGGRAGAGRAHRRRCSPRLAMHAPDPVPVLVKRLPHFEGLELPAYATDGAAGMDVLAAEDVLLAPGARHAVATGFALAIPAGLRDPGPAALGPRAQARDHRAQHARHDRFRLSRRAEGHPHQPRRGAFEVRRGDRIAQLVLAPVMRASWLKVDELDETRARRRRVRLDRRGDPARRIEGRALPAPRLSISASSGPRLSSRARR